MGRAIEGSDFSGYYIIGLLEARRVRTPGIPGSPQLSFGLRYRILNRTPHPMVLRSVNRLLNISDGSDMWIEKARASSAVARAEGDASPDRLLRPHHALTTWVVYDVPPGAKDPCMALFAAEFPDARRVLQLPRTKLHPPHDGEPPSWSLGEAPDARSPAVICLAARRGGLDIGTR